ncbi:unnamed protein product [Sympodiomycopsis kandeliae]
MPIATNSRTRFKKLSYKAPVVVHRGNLQQSTQQVEVEGIDENEAPNLGVDLSEVTEHHLQAALSSTQLANEGDKAIIAKPAYHIPTPDSKQILPSKDYGALYPIGSYQDPVTYVRSSTTVEDEIKGASYNLDEDDQEWLEERNKKASQAAQTALKELKPAMVTKLLGGKASKAKDPQTQLQLLALLAEENSEYRLITEDELEMIFTVMEHVTSEKAPFAHLDPEHSLPSLEDFLQAFDNDSALSRMSLPELPDLQWEKQALTPAMAKQKLQWSPDNPWRNLSALRPLVSHAYTWWQERRKDNGGKIIVPQLNFDESNDADPYVCFRRREVKLQRKTRKTDVLHLEKVVKLRLEMDRALAMLQSIAHREKTKRASLAQDRVCWETIKDLQDVKRVWGIVGPAEGHEDEDLISGEKREEAGYGVGSAPRKRRKVEEGLQIQTPAPSATGKSSVKKPHPSAEPGTGPGATSSGAGHNLSQLIVERARAVQSYIDRECLRKEETDRGWEEGSDSAYQPFPAPANIRNFRPVQTENLDPSNSEFQSSARSGRPPSFRRRLGRGGRIFLDRKLLAQSPVPPRLAAWPNSQGLGPGLKHASLSKDASTSQESNQLSERSNNTNPSPSQAGKKNSHELDKTNQKGSGSFTGPFAFYTQLRPSHLTTLPSSNGQSHQRSFASTSASQSYLSDTASASSGTTGRSDSSHDSSDSVTTTPTDVEDEDGLASHAAKRADLNDTQPSFEYDSDLDSDLDSDDDDDPSPPSVISEWRDTCREKWRYDDESGRWAGLGLCGLGGMEDDEEAVLDDFDQRFLRFRMTLLEEDDLHKLSTNWANVMQAQMALDCPPPPPQVSIIGPSLSGQVHSAGMPSGRTGADVASSAMSPPALPVGTPLAQVQAQAAAQAQAAHQLRQQQAAALAAASAAGGHALNASVAAMPPNAPAPLAVGQVATTTGAVAARAAQTNVGGPLSALQQQQQIHQAQVQMALQQHQQNQQRQAAAAAAAAAAQAQAQGQNQGRSSPNLQANRARMVPASAGQPHPLSQSHSFNQANGTGSPQSNVLQQQQQQQQQQSMGSGFPMLNQGSQPGIQQSQQRYNLGLPMQGQSAGSSPQMMPNAAVAAASQGRVSSSSPAPGQAAASPSMQHQQQTGQPNGLGGIQQSRSPSMMGMGGVQGQQRASFPQQQPAMPFSLAQLQQFQQQLGNNAPAMAQLQQHLAALHQQQPQNGGQQQPQQQQQQQHQMNGNVANQMQQLQQQLQYNVSNGNVQQSAAQALAMKAAFMNGGNGQNMQLKLPPNRVMQANGAPNGVANMNGMVQNGNQGQQQQHPAQRQPSQGSLSQA